MCNVIDLYMLWSFLYGPPCFRSLETDDYSHINATYYLLAERLLRKQQEIQENGSQWHKPEADSNKPLLAPLALSPR